MAVQALDHSLSGHLSQMKAVPQFPMTLLLEDRDCLLLIFVSFPQHLAECLGHGKSSLSEYFLNNSDVQSSKAWSLPAPQRDYVQFKEDPVSNSKGHSGFALGRRIILILTYQVGYGELYKILMNTWTFFL